MLSAIAIGSLAITTGAWAQTAAPTAPGAAQPGGPAAPSLNIPAAGAQRAPAQSLPATVRPELPRLPDAQSPSFVLPSTTGAGSASGPVNSAGTGAPSSAAPARELLPASGASSAAAAASSVSGAVSRDASGSTAAGITQAIHDLKLSVTAAGRIEALFVKEGDRVRKGDLLLHMDRSLEALEVKRREVMLEDNARLEELRAKELTLADQVRSAKTLLPTGGVSRKQVEDEELALGTIIAERKSIEFAKRRERVELDLAREAYERRHLRSPIDGVVTRIVSRLGESVAPHEPVMVVVDVRTVRFSGTVPLADAARVRSGSSVTVQLGSDVEPLRRVANLVFVSPVADPASGLVDVIAEFDNADGSVRPGIAGRIVAGSGGVGSLPGARGRR